MNGIRPISKKRFKQLREYTKLKDIFREKCGNVSELSGDNPDWQTTFNAEPHHITGRTGEKLINPFNVILVTRLEHIELQSKMNWDKKRELLAFIKPIRIAQGYNINDYRPL